MPCSEGHFLTIYPLLYWTWYGKSSSMSQSDKKISFLESQLRSLVKTFGILPHGDKKRRYARQAVSVAIRLGRLLSPADCDFCGRLDAQPQRHHTSPDSALECISLCPLCHGRLHAETRHYAWFRFLNLPEQQRLLKQRPNLQAYL